MLLTADSYTGKHIVNAVVITIPYRPYELYTFIGNFVRTACCPVCVCVNNYYAIQINLRYLTNFTPKP